MFRATPSIVSAVSIFVAKKRQTMHHVSASSSLIQPSTSAFSVSQLLRNNIIDNDLKSRIFVELGDLLLSGSYKYPRSSPQQCNISSGIQ